MSQWYSDDSYEAQAHARVMQAPHRAQLSHELIAAAASYEAMKAYQKHCEKNGQPASHAQAKEILAALGGAFIDHIVETKGLDFIDRQKAKHQAQEQLHLVSQRDYGGYERREYEPYGLDRREYETHRLERREFERPEFERPEFERPEFGRPEFEPHGFERLAYERREFEPHGLERLAYERQEHGLHRLERLAERREHEHEHHFFR